MLNRREEIDCDPSQQLVFPSSGRFDIKTLPLIRRFLERFPQDSCEFSLVNLYAWKDIYDYSWFTYQGRLLIYDGQSNCIFMPLGLPFSVQALYRLSHHLICMGLPPHIGMVSQAYIDDNPGLSHFYTVEKDRDAADYIYATRNLVALKGAKLHKKKNLVSQFKRRYPDYQVRPMRAGDSEKILGFSKDLLGNRQEIPRELLEELAAMDNTFKYWHAIQAQGLVVTVDRDIAAFSIFSRLNSRTYNVHFEKADFAYKGAAQLINHETARFLADQCEFINREQDLGIAGLRQAKMSYDPERLLVPAILKLKPNA